MLNFYDFEVFKHDWMVVIINPNHKTKEIIVNNREKLIDYYQKHKNEIWVGYNSKNYDQYILKSILLGLNPKSINDYIIDKKIPGYRINPRFNSINLHNYDVSKKGQRLKELEGFMGNDIRESSVPFDIDRGLTGEEIQKTIEYCTNDVEQTMEIFLRKKDDFEAQMTLIKEFNLPMACISMTKAKLASTILNARKRDLYDEWEIRLPETRKLEKYSFVADWFLDRKNRHDDSRLQCEIGEIPHVIAWGGLHGAISNYCYTCNSNELLVMIDVDQQYPTLMVKYDLLSRGARNKERYQFILDTSLRLKAEGKKKERKPYKDTNNITYGAMGDEYNELYDPLHRKLVCVFGQVLLIDLIEKIEGFSELIQSNTDGILVKIKRKDFDLLDDTVYEWEQRTGLSMGFDFFKKIVQKDVNNYIAVDFDGNLKRKGGYVKELNDLDNDLPIVNEAVVKFLTEGTAVEKTIGECNDLKMFQKIVKLSNKYKQAYHSGEKLDDKTFRVFASKKNEDGYIGKQKVAGGTIEKFANTPANCFIDNSDVNGKVCPEKLNKQWYIDLAIKRIEDFGFKSQLILF